MDCRKGRSRGLDSESSLAARPPFSLDVGEARSKLKYDEFVRGSPMSSTTSISVSEYLNSSYSPDSDFVDGRIEERSGGEHDHAAVQAALILWFGQRQNEWNIEVLPEQRIRVSPTKFRVPDICLVSLDQPVEQILTKPPLACIEILSPEDTLRRTQERINDLSRLW